MTNEAPEIRIDYVVVDLMSDYKIGTVGIQFEVEAVGDIKRFMPTNGLSGNKLEDMPQNIRLAVETLVAATRSKLEIPSSSVLGKVITPRVELTHVTYYINYPRHEEGDVALDGTFIWPGKGPMSIIHQNFGRGEFSPEQQRVFRQLPAWGRTQVEGYVESILGEVLKADLPPAVFVKRPRIFVSYRKTEAQEFAETIFHKLGNTRLFSPVMDEYDQEPGRWLAWVERLLQDSDGMVAIVSPTYESGPIAALERDWGILKTRRTTGFDLVPLLLTAEPGPFLSTFQWVDFREWQRDKAEARFEDAFRKLVDLLGHIKRNPY